MEQEVNRNEKFERYEARTHALHALHSWVSAVPRIAYAEVMYLITMWKLGVRKRPKTKKKEALDPCSKATLAGPGCCRRQREFRLQRLKGALNPQWKLQAAMAYETHAGEACKTVWFEQLRRGGQGRRGPMYLL